MGTTNIDGSDVILLDNEQVWRPTPTDIENLAVINGGIITITIKIDLGIIEYIKHLKIKNANPGITGFKLERINLNKEFGRATKEFNLYINVAMTNNEWSGLKYIELIPDEKSLLTYN